MTEITDDQLGVWEDLAAAATDGPWWTTEDLDDSSDSPAIGVAAGPSSGYASMVVVTPGDASYDAGEATAREADAVFIAAARDAVPALVAEVRRLRAALGQTDHVIAFDEHGWSIEHLVGCRPMMSRCEFHRAAQAAAEGWDGLPYPTGRYAVALEDGVLVVGEALEAAP